MNIGEFLSARRKQLKLSFSKVAEKVNYTPQAIYRYEKGNVKVDLLLVIPLCQALDLSVDSFFRMDINDIQPYENEKFSKEKYLHKLSNEIKKSHLTEKEFCDNVEISPSRYKKWMIGKTFPSVEEFITICKFLNVTEKELFLGIENQDENTSEEKFKEKKIIFPKRFLNRFGLSLLFLSCIAQGTSLISYRIKKDRLVANTNQKESSSSKEDDLLLDSTKIEDNKPVIYYNVTLKGYDLDSHSFLNGFERKYKVQQNTIFDQPTDISYPHYKMEGFESENSPFDFSTQISKDTEIIVNFKKEEYTINFLDYYGNIFNTQKIKYQESATEPKAPSIEGYEFLRYGMDSSRVEQDMNVPSIYTCTNCVLSIDLNGGEIQGYKSNYIVNNYRSNVFDSLPKPKKTGNEFVYYTSDDKPFNKDTLLTKYMSIKAHYLPLSYTITLSGTNKKLAITYGEKLNDLPDKLEDNTSISYWAYNGEKIQNGDIFDYTKNITLTPVIENSDIDYKINPDDSVTIQKVNSSSFESLDLTFVKGRKVSEVKEGALNNLRSLKTLIFNQEKVTIETHAFENLPNLKNIYFNNINTKSIINENAFTNCGKISHLTTGLPLKNNTSILKLKEYGIEPQEDFKFQFNDEVMIIPENYNQDFGTIAEFICGNNVCVIEENSLVSEGSKILKFTPGRCDACRMTLSLPDLNQNEMTFYGTALVTFKKIGTLNKLVMKNGSLTCNRLAIQELDLSTSLMFSLKCNFLYAKNVLLSDRVNPKQTVLYPKEKLDIDFYGCSSLPEEYACYSWLGDETKTTITYHSERKYDPDETVSYPLY